MPPSAEAHEFHTTHWSLVLSAGGDSTGASIALGRLCEAYWYPLYAFVRRQGHSADDAKDLTQEFFARLLAKNWLSAVSPDRGRFRSWLLASMKHFLTNEWDRARAEKRGGKVHILSIDEAAADERYRVEPSVSETAEHLFDRQWALTVLDLVLKQLRAEFLTSGKSALFDSLKDTLMGDRTPYAELSARLGLSEGALKVAVHRMRERYRDLIRAEIMRTIANPAEVNDEMRHLLTALSR